LELPNRNDIVIYSDITDKFLMESLERHQSVESIAAVKVQTQTTHVVRLMREVDAQAYNEKLAHPKL